MHVLVLLQQERRFWKDTFTDSMDRPGPDIECSMDPNALAELIEGSSIIAKCRGGKKGPVPEEQVTIDFAFATVVTTSFLRKGDVLSKENIWVKRPGTGEIPAESYEKVLGCIALCDMPEGYHLRFKDIGEACDEKDFISDGYSCRLWKLKSLINAVEAHKGFEPYIYVTWYAHA